MLAQQIVAVVAAAAIGGPDGTPTEIKADDVYALVRRADGFRELPHSAFEATLDMLSGALPRPRTSPSCGPGSCGSATPGC